nr:VWA domain-containing protein [Bacillota bacterium]
MDAWIESGEIKQIIIVTDGKSGSGASSVEAAKKAYDKGIVISAIGIIDSDAGSEREAEEAKKIAEAGGGLWYY